MRLERARIRGEGCPLWSDLEGKAHSSPPSADRVREEVMEKPHPTSATSASGPLTPRGGMGWLQGMWPRAGLGEELGNSPFRAVSLGLESPGSVRSALHIRVLGPRPACWWAWRV